MLKLGNKSISNLFIGQKAVTKAFLGQKLIWQKATGLPYDAEVEYLESTGTQYIDIDVMLGSSDVVSLVGMPKNGNSFFGNVTDANTRFNLTGSTGVQRFYFGAGGSGQYDASITFNQVHSYVCGRTFSIDGEVKNVFTVDDFTGTSTAYMFARRYTSGPNDFITGSIYWLKVEHNGVLVRDFIPVRKGGIGYMYDRVSGQLFGNQGSGNFIVGPDVVEVEYLESTGTQWILTDFSPKTTTDYEVEFSSTYTGTNSWVIGCPIWIGIHYKGATNEVGVTNGSTSQYQQYTSYAHDNSRITLKLQGNTVYANGVSLGTITRSNAYNNLDLALFAYRDVNQGATLQFSGSIYKVKIWDNNVLVRDFVPVRVGMEGAMKDKVTGKIYRNQGTGAFKIGADKKETPLMCNSYVKDGLIAMWDGVENAGWGTHDPNATVWKDLTGTQDAIISNGSFSDNGFIGSASASRPQSSDATFEVVATFNATETMYLVSCNDSTGGYYILTNTSQGNCRYRYSISRDGSNFWNPSFIVAEIGTPFYYSFSGDAATGVKYAYYNGAVTQTSGSQSGFANGTAPISLGNAKATLYCVRLYSRALTAEEIAWNYEIDKRRFNLT